VTAKFGYSILISDVYHWPFIQKSNTKIQDRTEHVDDSHDTKKIATEGIKDLGLEPVEDYRFIKFLRNEKHLPNLEALICVPQIELKQYNNQIKQKKPGHLINALEENDCVIHSTYFPRWFYNSRRKLQTIEQWYHDWGKKGLKAKDFAPPRDSSRYKKNSGVKPFQLETLTQLNLILICENGHLSDIPWPQYLQYKSDLYQGLVKKDDLGSELLSSYDSCCNNPKLEWSESKYKSEGYSSIFVECKNCEKKSNLEGIMNLAPKCTGERPWENQPLNSRQINGFQFVPHEVHREICTRTEDPSKRQAMRVALVTGNNTYFTYPFSSIFIPTHLTSGFSQQMRRAIDDQLEKLEKFNIAKIAMDENPLNINEFLEKFVTTEKLSTIYEDQIESNPSFIQNLKDSILEVSKADPVQDTHEQYKFEEYQCFINNDYSSPDEKNIRFKKVEIPKLLSPFIDRIQRVDHLNSNSTLLNFTRVTPAERIESPSGQILFNRGQSIYSVPDEEVRCLPVNKSVGEGIFWGFNIDEITRWEKETESTAWNESWSELVREHPGDQGASQRAEIKKIGKRYILVHTLAHLIMRELEFSCGYPTTSLKERLYLSDRMVGFLIYTIDGAEGSLGGLILQSEPDNMISLFVNALLRSRNCSMDPLCWESRGQGLFNLNLASCHACSLVNEISCEAWNLGLDRRCLLDAEWGFFRNLLSSL